MAGNLSTSMSEVLEIDQIAARHKNDDEGKAMALNESITDFVPCESLIASI